jgi:osmotically-inducible protein OsmY
MSTRNDQVLRSRLRDAFDADPSLDAFQLTVDVHDGIARLRGVVGSYAEKLEAVSVARRTDDVRDVVNDLTVRPYGADWRITDQQIGDDVRARIGIALVESGDVDFSVDHHVVTLSGRVPTVEERALVRHVVETAVGVDFVDNNIQIGSRHD